MTAVFQVRHVYSLGELADHLAGLIWDADQEIARMEQPGETLPRMTKRPTKTQVARYVAVLTTKADAWREVLAAIGQGE